MHKFIIIALLFISVAGKAQKPIDFRTADSITYQCYLSGDWDKLISIGNQALEQNIDYKKLRQRIGYAFFVKGDYYSALKHYEKALAFDQYDADTRAYLYYCELNTGNEVLARFQVSRLTPEIQQHLKVNSFNLIDAFDVEYNYKSNNSGSRSNPTYMRAGVNTQLSYRLSLYESVSNYSQTYELGYVIKQPEYYALLSWAATSHTSFNIAYHFLNTTKASVNIPGNMVFAALTTQMNRFHIGINGSLLHSTSVNTKQFGILAGVTLEGSSNIYFNSALNQITEKSASHTIFSQSIGARFSKTWWAEANVTAGNLNNYNDFNALYVYNALDPTVFRTGLTMFWYLGKQFTITANYTYDSKQIELTQIKYIQQSFLGGIRWKL